MQLQSLLSASTERGQMFFVADFFGNRQFVALNPPVACRHSHPHEVLEAYTIAELLNASGVWGPEPGHLYAPSPGTVAPLLNPPDGQVLIYNIDNCRPEYTTHPIPEPSWILCGGGGLSYWMPYRHISVPLNQF